MNDAGNSILEATRTIRRLLEDVALLLSTVQSAVKKVGWVPEGNNTAKTEGSGSLKEPRKWLPYNVFRFFRVPERPSILAFVAVILDSADTESLVHEPIVCAGWYDFGRGKRPGKEKTNWWYECARWHLELPESDRRDDGTLVSVDPRKVWPDQNYHMEAMNTFAVPLAGIENERQLQEKVIKPLLERVGQKSRLASTP